MSEQEQSDSPTALFANAVFRDGRDDDLAYVIPCWMTDFWQRMPRDDSWRRMRQPVFECVHSATIKSILSRSRVRVAVDPEGDSTIWGWAVTQDLPVPIVHYVYVKQPARNNGIARKLLDHMPAGFAFTHHTPAVADWLIHRKRAVVPVSNPEHPHNGTIIIPTPDGVPVFVQHLMASI